MRGDSYRPIHCALMPNWFLQSELRPRSEIAELLLAHGARYTIFIAVLRGDAEFVRDALARDRSLTTSQTAAITACSRPQRGAGNAASSTCSSKAASRQTEPGRPSRDLECHTEASWPRQGAVGDGKDAVHGGRRARRDELGGTCP